MGAIIPAVSQATCRISEVRYILPEATCDRCERSAPRFSLATRIAIDLNLDHPVLLHVTVSVHHCQGCKHYFRARPPFLRADAIYTNRVVIKAVQSVYNDGMAIRQVSDRLARDFCVQPSEGTIRRWCRAYSAAFDFETDYQGWVVNEFSGILCVDEVYQDKVALLLAVDPAAPDGDRLVGYRLTNGTVNTADVEAFLTGVKAAGIEPDEVITDGSALYPTVLGKVWPVAAHQLCLFHEIRKVTKGVMRAINAVRKSLPRPPSSSSSKRRGTRPLHSQPPSNDPEDPATRHWHRRQEERDRQIALVHNLENQGFSQRAIARRTGFHRNTVREWLKMEKPDVPLEELLETSTEPVTPIPRPGTDRRDRMRRAHELSGQGLSYSEIGRRVGAHRVTVKKWLQQPPPAEEEPPLPLKSKFEPPPPPELWKDWDQVREVREALQEHRFLLLRRPENLDDEEQGHVAALLSGPVGPKLQVAYDFLNDWYRIWKDEEGQRRMSVEAQARYDTWRTDETYASVPALRQVQKRMTADRFDRLGQFLRQPEWEATNNGAERAGRSFRHRQAPHFNLRTVEAISGAITVAACLRKEAAMMPAVQSLHTCQRGRKRRCEPPVAPAMFEGMVVEEVQGYT